MELVEPVESVRGLAESRNTGKPIEMTRTDEVSPLADELRFFADQGRAMRAARQLDFGAVWINTHIPFVSEMP